jgi:hypothetical protein
MIHSLHATPAGILSTLLVSPKATLNFWVTYDYNIRQSWYKRHAAPRLTSCSTAIKLSTRANFCAEVVPIHQVHTNYLLASPPLISTSQHFHHDLQPNSFPLSRLPCWCIRWIRAGTRRCCFVGEHTTVPCLVRRTWKSLHFRRVLEGALDHLVEQPW